MTIFNQTENATLLHKHLKVQLALAAPEDWSWESSYKMHELKTYKCIHHFEPPYCPIIFCRDNKPGVSKLQTRGQMQSFAFFRLLGHYPSHWYETLFCPLTPTMGHISCHRHQWGHFSHSLFLPIIPKIGHCLLPLMPEKIFPLATVRPPLRSEAW